MSERGPRRSQAKGLTLVLRALHETIRASTDWGAAQPSDARHS